MQLPNYTQVSNEFISQMHRYKGSEIKVFLAISRKTIGWHKLTDKVSYSQLSKMTGITSHNTLQNSIKTLVDDGWITQRGNEKTGYIYDLNLEPMSKTDTAMSKSDIDTMSKSDTTKETNKETNIKQNNSDAAVDFKTSKNEKIVFAWSEIQKLSSETGISKEEVAETLLTALKRADTTEKVKNLKGWAISAVRNGWPLDEKEKLGEAEAEYQSSRERNEREARATKTDIAAIKKAAIENPDAQKFFRLFDKIASKPSADEMIRTEDNEKKLELHKQRMKVLKEELRRREGEEKEAKELDLEKVMVPA